MQDIFNKISKLKKYNRRIADGLTDCRRLNELPADHVSITGLTRSDIYDKIEKVKKCCDILEIKEFPPEDGGESEFKISNANYCNIPSICPICGATKQSKNRRRLAEKIKECNEKYKYVYMVTFTVAKYTSLYRQMHHLKKSFKGFRKLGQYRKYRDGYDGGEYGKVRAGFMSFEIKRGKKSGEWHVHAHALFWTSDRLIYDYYDPNKKHELIKRFKVDTWADVPREAKAEAVRPECWRELNGRRVPVSKITGEWLECTGDSIHADVRLIGYRDDIKYRKNPAKYHKKINKITFEVLTYYSKLIQNPHDDSIDILLDTHFFKFFSSFRDIRKTDYEPEIKEHYKMYSSVYDREKDGYKEPRTINGELFRNIDDQFKKKFLEISAKIQGEYRRHRNDLLRASPGRSAAGLSEMLDIAKGVFKRRVRDVWEHYSHVRIKYTLDRDIEKIALDREIKNRRQYLKEFGIQVAINI